VNEKRRGAAQVATASMLLIAAEQELPHAKRIWGSPGWLPPEDREATDWLSLALLHGWNPVITRVSDQQLEPVLAGGIARVVVGCDPDSLSQGLVHRLIELLHQEEIIVISRTGAAGGRWSSLAGCSLCGEQIIGSCFRWAGPGPEGSWSSRRSITCETIAVGEGLQPWLTVSGAPVIVARPVGRGVVVSLGFHPSRARDEDGAATAILSYLLRSTVPSGTPSCSWENVMVLRMDDPGGAQNVHLKSWSYPKLAEAAWRDVGAVLRDYDARISIGYVSSWVDDGCENGTHLSVEGRQVPREPGRTYPSPLVRYRDRAGVIHDYAAEYRGIEALRADGLAEVEVHGYTHIHPDRHAWLRAPDRYVNVAWFREFGAAAQPVLDTLPSRDYPTARAIEAFETFFRTSPTTLIFPGEAFTDQAVEKAIDLGISLIGSYYLGIRHQHRVCWAQHVCSPYLDEADDAWFAAGLPVIGYFHDRDLAIHGVDWFGRCLGAWCEAGAQRFVTYGDIARVCAPPGGF
jgi:hypothetical protein